MILSSAKSFLAAALAGATLIATPAEARHRHGDGGDDAAIAIGAGLVGLAIGAAIASDRDDDYYDGYYGDRYYRGGGYYGPSYYGGYYSYPSYYRGGYYYSAPRYRGNYRNYRNYRPVPRGYADNRGRYSYDRGYRSSHGGGWSGYRSNPGGWSARGRYGR